MDYGLIWINMDYYIMDMNLISIIQGKSPKTCIWY